MNSYFREARGRKAGTLRKVRLALWAAAVTGCAPLWALAQSAVHAPGNAPTHADDFNGIWAIENGEINRTLDKVSKQPPPPYRPEWLAAWNTMHGKMDRGERIIPIDKECWPPGMPGAINWVYPGEILMTPGQITMIAEYETQVRRIFTDGRGHPSADDLEPTMEGHSIGHWEGKTLVIDTVGIRPEAKIAGRGGHSVKEHIVEHVRLLSPDKLEWLVTIEDPIALTKPFTMRLIMVRQPPDIEIREYICEENNVLEPYSPSTVDVVWPDPNGPMPAGNTAPAGNASPAPKKP